MCKILLSINPEHVENIMAGTKIYEFRKIQCKEKVDKIIIYSTFPVMKVVGEADVVDIIVDNPDNVWNTTNAFSGISKQFFDDYYRNRDKAIAYKLSNVKRYQHPKDLSSYGIKYAPQSFVYI
jgi:predicted transcriptional regulator